MNQTYHFSTVNGPNKHHILDQENLESLCRKAEPVIRTDGQPHQGYIHRFKGFDRKPEKNWCIICRRRYQKQEVTLR